MRYSRVYYRGFEWKDRWVKFEPWFVEGENVLVTSREESNAVKIGLLGAISRDIWPDCLWVYDLKQRERGDTREMRVCSESLAKTRIRTWPGQAGKPRNLPRTISLISYLISSFCCLGPPFLLIIFEWMIAESEKCGGIGWKQRRDGLRALVRAIERRRSKSTQTNRICRQSGSSPAISSIVVQTALFGSSFREF